MAGYKQLSMRVSFQGVLNADPKKDKKEREGPPGGWRLAGGLGLFPFKNQTCAT